MAHDEIARKRPYIKRSEYWALRAAAARPKPPAHDWSTGPRPYTKRSEYWEQRAVAAAHPKRGRNIEIPDDAPIWHCRGCGDRMQFADDTWRAEHEAEPHFIGWREPPQPGA